MKRAGWGFFFLLAMATFAVAQVPTVDNFTLEKYQKQRVTAQRDYEQNYARLGFPSPEELDRQREADMNARLQLADQLRQARLEPRFHILGLADLADHVHRRLVRPAVQGAL